MPHDIKGNELSVGDTVSVICAIEQITETEDYCNLSVVTLLPMLPGKQPSRLTLNTRQVELVKKAEVKEAKAHEAAAT